MRVLFLPPSLLPHSASSGGLSTTKSARLQTGCHCRKHSPNGFFRAELRLAKKRRLIIAQLNSEMHTNCPEASDPKRIGPIRVDSAVFRFNWPQFVRMVGWGPTNRWSTQSAVGRLVWHFSPIFSSDSEQVWNIYTKRQTLHFENFTFGKVDLLISTGFL